MKKLWTWIGVVITGAIGSVVATMVFDLRLPPWLMKPKGDPPAQETVIDWWRTCGLIGAIAAVLIVVLVLVASRSPREPTFRDYTKDSFFGLTWRWRYGPGEPIQAGCFCPQCDRQLVATEVD